jgi:hypothetical protein
LLSFQKHTEIAMACPNRPGDVKPHKWGEVSGDKAEIGREGKAGLVALQNISVIKFYAALQ